MMISLFVGRLPYDFEDRSLEQLFNSYGNIISCKVKRGGRFGIVTVFSIFIEYLSQQK